MTELGKIATWFAGSDTGVSACTIAAFMCGADMESIYTSHPRDPGDMGRCLRLLETFPEWKARLPEIASLSPQWASLIKHWDQVETTMYAEVGRDWSKGNSAPHTYKLMKRIGL